MKNRVHKSTWFYGNKISPYGLENGYLDYRTLASSFAHVMCNDFLSVSYEHGIYDWDLVSGYDTDDDDDPVEVYQWFVVDGNGAQILEEFTDDPVYYNEEFDIYLWGVTHWGTSWDYVLTDVKLELEEDVS